ncbi:MAG TPA: class II fructose-1,6-bisphosphate aldolase [Tissierellaceae bacterium]|nr:class II fructose-1,6-bisphosphate aldolase [Tissierellaceae bacterium]
MNIVPSKDMLWDAKKNGYAIPAFNIHNLETLQAVLEGAWEMRSPVMIATTPGTVNYAGVDFLVAMVKAGARMYDIPIALHLDHCTDIDFINECINAGYRSVMIDASMKDFEDNIEISKSVVELAKKHNVTVEAELGRVGGEEDGIKVEKKDEALTDPDKALEFVDRTGIDSLAVAIGTAHGMYRFEPELDFERLIRINKLVDIPLVLHGGSGVPNESITTAIRHGICKVNIATELKIPFAESIREYFATNPEADDPRKYLTPGKERVKQVVIEKIKLCGSGNRA